MADKPEPFETDSGPGRKRNSCKAVVVKNGRILLTVNRDHLGDFYLLPGGGQQFGETAHETVIREVLEETGWLVRPGEMVLSRDYIGANHEFADEEGDVHQTELIFCALPVEYRGQAAVPDPWQIGTDWVEPAILKDLRIYPAVLKGILPEIVNGEYNGPLY
ncbi:MAG: NUDIX domain-containing protein, partial [Candidatus Aegiribacteria sp.]|nr:NUDIX domain-containing protein [Candidatus Aegiribacteria sp.]MBD3294934.1 NUDIX domain-containing protein [Candidatus Fermentibacteria bacterium]